MTPDDLEAMNNILVEQSSENEIYIQGLLEQIRDLNVTILHLKAEIDRLQAENANLRRISPYVRKWD